MIKSDPLKRALRTYLQSVLGVFSGLWISSGIAAHTLPGVADLALLGKLLMAALVGGVPALISYVQNLLEDHTSLPALLKDDGDTSAPDPENK